jgi:hypothetical protein
VEPAEREKEPPELEEDLAEKEDEPPEMEE